MCLTRVLKSSSLVHEFLLETRLGKRLKWLMLREEWRWADAASYQHMGWSGAKGQIMFGEDTESLSGAWLALGHNPAPKAQAAPHRHCLLSFAKLLPTSTRGAPSMSCLLEQYTMGQEDTPGQCEVLTTCLFCLFMSCNSPVHEARTLCGPSSKSPINYATK